MNRYRNACNCKSTTDDRLVASIISLLHRCGAHHPSVLVSHSMAHLARLALRPSMLRASASSRPTASAASLMAVRSVHVSRTAHAEVVDKDPQLGDYPQPPMESTQTRRYDPRYWDRQEKKNFGETVCTAAKTGRTAKSTDTDHTRDDDSFMNRTISWAFGHPISIRMSTLPRLLVRS